MRILLLIIVLLITACSQNSSNKAKVRFTKVGFFATANLYHGGVKIWGTEGGKQIAFSMTMFGENDQKNIEVDKGNWNFYAVGWTGPNPYEGTVRCGTATKSLVNADESVDITLSPTNCDNYFSSSGYTETVSSNLAQFKRLEIVSCNNSTTAGSSNDCNSSSLGNARSYRVGMPDFASSALYPTAAGRSYSFPLYSDCIIDSNNDSKAFGDTRLPVGTFAMSPLVVGVRAYGSNDCSGTTIGEYLFHKNLMVPDSAMTHGSLSYGGGYTRLFLEDIVAPADLPVSLVLSSSPTPIVSTAFTITGQLKKIDTSNFVGSQTYSVALSAWSDSNCNTIAAPGSLSGISASIVSGTGAVTFPSVVYSQIGTIYIKAIVSGGIDIQTCSNAITLTAGGADNLYFPTQPAVAVNVGTALAPSFTVQLRDSGNAIKAAATDTVTLSAYTGSDCITGYSAVLSAGQAVAGAAGVATFSGLTFSTTGSYYLKAEASGYTSTCTGSAITVSPLAVPDHIEFEDLESNVMSGAAFNFTVKLKQAGGADFTSNDRTVTVSAWRSPDCSSTPLSVYGTFVPDFSGTATTISGSRTFPSTTFTLTSGSHGEFYIKAYSSIENYTACRKVIVSPCPSNYVYVNANPLVGTYKDFCVAKYEAKSGPTFVSTGVPDTSVSPTAASANCIGLGHHLVTNEEWMTVARSIEYNPNNWTSGIGSVLNYGHSDSLPNQMLSASEDDLNACYQTTALLSNPSCVTGGAQTRVLELMNGERIWDFAGNASEWVDWDQITPGIQTAPANSLYLSQTDAYTVYLGLDTTIYSSLFAYSPSLFDWNDTYGMGNITWAYGGNAYVARGGNYQDGSSKAGIYGINMAQISDTPNGMVGYRCAYTLPSPNNSGSTMTPYVYDLGGSNPDGTTSAVLDHSGQLITVGSYYISSEWISFLKMYDGVSLSPIGSPVTFGAFNGMNEKFQKILIDDNNRVIVLGTVENAGEVDTFVLRYTQDGNLDPTFDSDGIVEINGTEGYNAGLQQGISMTLDEHRNIVVVGQASSGTAEAPAIWRIDEFGAVTSLFLNSSLNGNATDVKAWKNNTYLVLGNHSYTDMDLWGVNLDSPSVFSTTFTCNYCSGEELITNPHSYNFFVVGSGDLNLGTGMDAIVWSYQYSNWGTINLDTFSYVNLDIGTTDQFGVSGKLYDGNIYVVSETTASGDAAIAITSISSSTGLMNNSFSGDGLNVYAFGGENRYPNELLINGKGELYIIGESDDGIGGLLNSFFLKVGN